MDLMTLTIRYLLEGTDEAQQEIQDTTNEAEKSASKMTSAFKKIGAAVVSYFAIDKIKEFGVAAVNAAASVAAEASAFEQIMGNYSDNAQKKLKEVADATGMMNSRLQPYMTSLTAKFKGLGNDIDTSTSLATRGLTVAANASAFWDKSLDDAMGGLNSFINGSYEGGEAIGLFANDTQLAQYAIKQGLVSTTAAWSSLDEKTKQATRLEYAENMMALSGATGQASKESGQYANVMANFKETWRQFLAVVGQPVMEAVIPIVQDLSVKLQGLGDWVKKVQTWFQENRDTVEKVKNILVALTVATVAYVATTTTMSIIKSVTTWINGMTIAQRLLNVAMSANPIGLVVSALALLVTGLVAAYNNNEEFRRKITNAWNSIKSFLNNFNLFEIGKNIVNGLWNGIKSAWSWLKSGWEKLIGGLGSGAKKQLKISSPSKVFEQIGNQTVDGLENSVRRRISGIGKVGENLGQAIIDPMKTVGGSVGSNITSGLLNESKSLLSDMDTQGSSIGKAIVDGIDKGITDNWDAFIEAWGLKVEEIPATANEKLEIHSPSKVGQRVGENWVAGINVGITNTAIASLTPDALTKANAPKFDPSQYSPEQLAKLAELEGKPETPTTPDIPEEQLAEFESKLSDLTEEQVESAKANIAKITEEISKFEAEIVSVSDASDDLETTTTSVIDTLSTLSESIEDSLMTVDEDYWTAYGEAMKKRNEGFKEQADVVATAVGKAMDSITSVIYQPKLGQSATNEPQLPFPLTYKEAPELDLSEVDIDKAQESVKKITAEMVNLSDDSQSFTDFVGKQLDKYRQILTQKPLPEDANNFGTFVGEQLDKYQSNAQEYLDQWGKTITREGDYFEELGATTALIADAATALVIGTTDPIGKYNAGEDVSSLTVVKEVAEEVTTSVAEVATEVLDKINDFDFDQKVEEFTDALNPSLNTAIAEALAEPITKGKAELKMRALEDNVAGASGYTPVSDTQKVTNLNNLISEVGERFSNGDFTKGQTLEWIDNIREKIGTLTDKFAVQELTSKINELNDIVNPPSPTMTWGNNVQEKLEDLTESGESFRQSFSTALDAVRSKFGSLAESAVNVFNAIAESQQAKTDNKIALLDQELSAAKSGYETDRTNENERYQGELDELDRQLKAKEISQRKYNDIKETLAQENQDNLKTINDQELDAEEEIKNKKNELDKKQWEANKKNSLATIWINLASSIMRAYAENHWLIATGVAAANTAVAMIQSKSIMDQQYTPAFATGGIVDSPTTALIGEAGREAVVPLENNLEWVNGLAKAMSPALTTQAFDYRPEIHSIREELVEFKLAMVDKFNQLLGRSPQIVLDSGVLVGAIAPRIDTSLGNINRLRGRGM